MGTDMQPRVVDEPSPFAPTHSDCGPRSKAQVITVHPHDTGVYVVTERSVEVARLALTSETSDSLGLTSAVVIAAVRDALSLESNAVKQPERTHLSMAARWLSEAINELAQAAKVRKSKELAPGK